MTTPKDIHGIGVTGHPSPGGAFTPSAASLPSRRCAPPGGFSETDVLASRLACHPDLVIRQTMIARALDEAESRGYDRGVRDATEAGESGT